MDIPQTATTTPPRTAPPVPRPAIASDFETFLRMMTAQLQNQDPLNPVDSADYAVQLATFSGVEQQAKTNQLLEAMKTEFGVMGMAQLAGWVGRQALAAGPVQLQGTPVTLMPKPATGADQAVLAVYDATGTLVVREGIPVSDKALDWLPVDATGAALPPGLYSIRLESLAGDRLLSTTDVEAYARIAEVRGGASGTVLVLAGGAVVPASTVTALRE